MNTAAQSGGGGLIIWAMLVIFFIWLLLSGNSQKKREQERQNKVAALQKGDQVILQNGIVATVVGFHDNTLEVKIAENVKITILKSGIVGFISDATPVKQGGAK